MELEVRSYESDAFMLKAEPKMNLSPFTLSFPLKYKNISVSDPEGNYGLADPDSGDYFSAGVFVSF